jgi:hypothetical protein
VIALRTDDLGIQPYLHPTTGHRRKEDPTAPLLHPAHLGRTRPDLVIVSTPTTSPSEFEPGRADTGNVAPRIGREERPDVRGLSDDGERSPDAQGS